MAVDLVGLDQVDEHEPLARAPRAARATLASACALVAPGCDWSMPDAREQVADLAHAVHLHAGALKLLQVAAPRRAQGEVAPPVGALETPPARPLNGPRDDPPDSVLAASSARAPLRTRGRAPSAGTRSTCAASCSTESWEV